MSRNAFLFQLLHDVVGHTVVDNTLANDCALLLAVECSCIVLIVYDHNFRILGCEYFLCLALIELLCFFPISHFLFLQKN